MSFHLKLDFDPGIYSSGDPAFWPAAQGAFISPGQLKSPKGRAGLRPAKPKKKDTTCVVSFFLACVDEKDAEIQKQGRPARRQTKPEPSKAGPVWRGGATE